MNAASESALPAIVDVAVAVILNEAGEVLLAQRPPGKVYEGYWEFPGGKVEPGETVRQALDREIDEELGVIVSEAWPWITQVFTYPHATVRLHFYRVTGWQGEPSAVEHSGLVWQRPAAITVAPLLPANGPVLKALLLPKEYAISAAAALGEAVFLTRLQQRLEGGLRLVQLREKTLAPVALAALAEKVIALVHGHGARVLINGDAALAQRLGADGVHLTAAQLMQAAARPDLPWCAASCHNAAELRAAEKLGLDFAVLGPVLPTPSHPGAPALGWESLAELVQGCAIPVYALGGLNPDLLGRALEHGAQGIAMLSGSWKSPVP